jgi:alpha-1,2-mannosyltransferase
MAMPALVLVLVSLLLTAVISVVFLFLPTALRLLARLVGHRLRRSSRTRRELLLDRVAAETTAFEAAHTEKSREHDDDWEKIAPSPSGHDANRGKPDADWSGIVGFLHPFW